VTATHPAAENAASALPKSWDPGAVEADLYQGWVDAGYFTADPASDKPAYSIVLPPPNVTGSLHMGHALDHTLMDALTRRKRMQGFEVLWLPGMDHAGIATQTVVEKQLAVDGKTKEDFGRESTRCGTGSANPAAPSAGRCAASATASTGAATGSPWTRACRARCAPSSRSSTTRG
jgi:isoleucyl-tRNA synthetase